MGIGGKIMNKYEEAKLKAKAIETADKVVKMNPQEYEMFMRRMVAKKEILDAKKELAELKLSQINENIEKKREIPEGNANFAILASTVGAGVLGCLVSAGNVSPNALAGVIVLTSSIGSAICGTVLSAVGTFLYDEKVISNPINKFRAKYQKRSIEKLGNLQRESDILMREIDNRMVMDCPEI